MRCEDCRHSVYPGFVLAARLDPGTGQLHEVYVFCPGCQGSGVASCCEGAVGRADEITNIGDKL